MRMELYACKVVGGCKLLGWVNMLSGSLRQLMAYCEGQ